KRAEGLSAGSGLPRWVIWVVGSLGRWDLNHPTTQRPSDRLLDGGTDVVHAVVGDLAQKGHPGDGGDANQDRQQDVLHQRGALFVPDQIQQMISHARTLLCVRLSGRGRISLRDMGTGY